MKNIIRICALLSALLCALSLCACDTTPPQSSGYAFKSGEVSFTVGDDADAVVSRLGEYVSYSESPSCGGGAEPDKTYTYSGFKFDTINTGGKNVIVKIVLLDDSVSTPEGITIGSSKDEVIGAYGEGYTEASGGALTYTDEKCALMIAFKDSAVSAIHYVEK